MVRRGGGSSSATSSSSPSTTTANRGGGGGVGGRRVSSRLKVKGGQGGEKHQITIDQSFQRKKNPQNTLNKNPPQLIDLVEDEPEFYFQNKQSSSTSSKSSKSKLSSTTTSKLRESSGDDDLKLLRSFDLEQKYGPTIGITRLERYERAIKFNLRPKPDPKIKRILNNIDELNQKYTLSIWEQNKLLQTIF